VSHLAAAAMANPETPETLESGDILRFEVIEDRGDVVVIEHPEFGRMEIRRPQADDQPDPTTEAEETGPPLIAESAMPGFGEDETKEQKHDGLFGTRFMRGWDSSLGAGLTGSSGGFDDTKLNIRFHTGLSKEDRLWFFEFVYLLNIAPQTEGEDLIDRKTTKNQGFLLGRRSWLYPNSPRWRKWSTFAQSRYQYDEFQLWKHRISATAGVGYRLVDTKKWTFLPRLGFGGAWTGGNIDDLYPEVMIAFDLTWKPNQRTSIVFQNELFNSLENDSRFRTVQSLEWQLMINRYFSFDLGLHYQRDTDSQGRENDLTYFGALSYTF
jgi:hypothetical protein